MEGIPRSYQQLCAMVDQVGVLQKQVKDQVQEHLAREGTELMELPDEGPAVGGF